MEQSQYHRLGLALKKDPEANMIDMLSTDYPKKLQSFKSSTPGSSRCQPDGDLSYISDPRSKLVTTEPFTIIHELSAEVKQLLNPGDLSKALLDLLHRGDILFQTACVMVLKIGMASNGRSREAGCLQQSRRSHLSSQVNPFLHGTPFGGVGGEGCKDIRRNLRMNSEPIYNEEAFKDFVFSGSRSASTLYTNLLRNLIPPTSVKCVFTHGIFDQRISW
ncbi:hypothetical protein FCULG_00012841 [Fusarium culmorum]|uniref:Uncharacterized protein n=1 Tax=Fusarium culmorum TaxID=5516 RepID=A0A2T4GFY8_FUSCU|nr:hypothetical protein FCULG_00012841 [Fusarium culmorum]